MALPISPKLEQSFTPPGVEADPPPVYRFFPPTLRDREKWRARLESLGGAVISASRLRAIVESGLKALCSEPSDVDTLLAVWDLAAERETAAREVGERLSAAATAHPGDEAAIAPFLAELKALELSPGEQDQLEQLDAMLRRYHRPFQRAREAQRLHNVLAPRVACQLFLTGWSNVAGDDGIPVPFRKFAGEVMESTLDALPPDHVLIVGMQILTNAFASGDDAKKPASPSGSPAGPTSSSEKTASPSSDPVAG